MQSVLGQGITTLGSKAYSSAGLVKKGKRAVSNNQRFYTAANANVLDGATKVRCKLARSALAKLEKSEVAKMASEDHLESHQSGMEDKLSGKNDPETMEWIRNIEAITKSNEESKAAFLLELNKRFESKDDKWWDEVRRGSKAQIKMASLVHLIFFAYYTQYFTETELSCIFGVLRDNHNTNLALEKLIDVRILRKSNDERGSIVYVLIDMLKMNLRYKADAEIEESVRNNLEQLYREGNLIIKKKDIIEPRKKQKRVDNDNDVQNSDSEEKEEENDDNDHDVQNSNSGEEEEENDDDDNDVHNSVSDEEVEVDEAEEVNIYKV